MAVAMSTLLAIALVLVGLWAVIDPYRSGPSGVATKGGAGGDGDGTGSGMSGLGPGAGLKGDGPGADPESTSDELQGTPDGVTTQTAARPSGTNAPSSPSRAAPDFGFTAPDQPEVQQPQADPVPAMPIGTGSAPAREGASGAARPGVPEFLGVKAEGRNVVYVLDFSGSMYGEKIAYLKIELKRSLFALTAANQFQVVLFNNNAIQNPTPGMLAAGKTSTRNCAAWVDSQSPDGGTDPTAALELALKTLKPDAIYLLTDGVFDSDPAVFAVLAKHNAERRVQVNTIGFGLDVNAVTLQRIADENRGTYRLVNVPGPPP